jgi:endogenous inhibitor of DNA gyrase (YacG/DUF329 family)
MEIENRNNSDYYKYSSNSIKKMNLDLWNQIDSIKLDITFKEKFYLMENDMNELPICYCGNKVKFIDMSNGFRQFCSKRCMIDSSEIKEKRKKSCIDKYGVDNPSKSDIIKLKTISSNNEKFGVDYPLQSKEIMDNNKSYFIKTYGVDNPSKVKEIREKAQKTMLLKYGVEHAIQNTDIKSALKSKFEYKYGVDNPSKVKEIREKAQKTMLLKYGVEHAMQNDSFIDKMKNTNLIKYGKESYSQTNSYKENIKEIIFERNSNMINNDLYYLLEFNQSQYKILCKVCNQDFEIHRQLWRNRIKNSEIICLNCNPIKNSISKDEKKIFEFVSKYHNNIIENHRIDNKEIDIYLNDFNIGFEYNGLYWHSELHKPNTYHIDKTKFFNKIGIELFHIWEDDWNYKQDIVKSMILNRLGKTLNKIFARKCEIREINDNQLVRKFLEMNHIQGFVGSKIKLGLFYNNELVSLMTFGNLRKSLGQKFQEGIYEMLRFCNKLNTNVVGGASKLFKYFIKNYKPIEVISYSDNSRGQGNLYKKLGFNLLHETVPNYYWSKNGIKHHRFNFRKDKLVKEGADPNKTEIQIMSENGFYRIFDCGSKKWKFS